MRDVFAIQIWLYLFVQCMWCILISFLIMVFKVNTTCLGSLNARILKVLLVLWSPVELRVSWKMKFHSRSLIDFTGASFLLRIKLVLYDPLVGLGFRCFGPFSLFLLLFIWIFLLGGFLFRIGFFWGIFQIRYRRESIFFRSGVESIYIFYILVWVDVLSI